MATSNVVEEVLSSATSTASAMGKSLDVQLYDSSSYSGGWQVERRLGSSWYKVSDVNTSTGYAEGTEANLPYSVVVDNAKARDVRVTAVSYSSGDLGVVIA